MKLDIFKDKNNKDDKDYTFVKHFDNEVAVSILNANFYNLSKIIKIINTSNADAIHYDVMDGHFVSNISFGHKILCDIKPYTKKALEVHLMISDPIVHVQKYIDAGADMIIVHFESFYYREIKQFFLDLRAKKIGCGISIKPETNIEQIYEYLDFIDEVMIMTVQPGKGGQKFIQKMLEKIAILSNYLYEKKLYKNIKISVDGGIDDKTALMCSKVGVTKFVSGNYLLKNNISAGIDKIKNVK